MALVCLVTEMARRFRAMEEPMASRMSVHRFDAWDYSAIAEAFHRATET
jgi:hypothetical protein